MYQDVFITDNKPKTPKYVVNNDKELEAFMAYQESLEAYNSDMELKPHSVKPPKGKYKKGSFAQKVFEPLLEAEKDENGTYFLKVDHAELFHVNEEEMRKIYENRKDHTNEVHEEEVESDEFRAKLFADLESENISLDRWNEIIAEEIGVFKRDEEYDYVTDLRRNFDHVLETSQLEKIFRTIPEHVFWDIKKPMYPHLKVNPRKNRSNPTRQPHIDEFFDGRRYEEWRRNRHTKRDLNQNISMFTRY